MDPKQIAAFIEYCARPLMGDVREILEKLEKSKILVHRKDIQVGIATLIVMHLGIEFIRAATYITIAILVCRTVASVL